MAYRLYTQDVADGYTDFNDDNYHVLESSRREDGVTVALVFKDNSYFNRFIVAYGLDYHNLESISWLSCNEYQDLVPAFKQYNKLLKS